MGIDIVLVIFWSRASYTMGSCIEEGEVESMSSVPNALTLASRIK
jgi:hypothetical protein